MRHYTISEILVKVHKKNTFIHTYIIITETKYTENDTDCQTHQVAQVHEVDAWVSKHCVVKHGVFVLEGSRKPYQLHRPLYWRDLKNPPNSTASTIFWMATIHAFTVKTDSAN